MNEKDSIEIISKCHSCQKGLRCHDNYKSYLKAIKKAEGLAKAVKLYLKLDKDGYPIGTDVNLEEAFDKWNKEK